MPHHVRVFVPTTQAAAGAYAIQQLTEAAGGVTVHYSSGSWADEDGTVHTESVNVLEAYHTEAALPKVKDALVKIIEALREAGEKAVLIEVNSKGRLFA